MRQAEIVICPETRRANYLRDRFRLSVQPHIVWNCPTLRREGCVSGQTGEQFEQLQERDVVIRHGTLGPGHLAPETIRSMRFWPLTADLVFLGVSADSNRCTGDLYGSRRLVGELAALAAREGVGDRVHFFPPVPSDQVHSAIQGSTVGLATYSPAGDINRKWMATASVKFFDYMKAGIPIVAGTDPGFRDLIEEFACGHYIESPTPEKIGAAVRSLLEDEHGRAVGSNGRTAHATVCNYEHQFAPVLAALEAGQQDDT